MKSHTTLKSLFMILLTVFAFGVNAGGGKSVSLDYKPGQYNLDPAHTRAAFEIPHFVISRVEGRFNDVTGKATLAKDFDDSKFEATIKVASIDTAVDARDNHLKSADFFNAEKYPVMTLKSKKIEGSKESFELIGDLTIKDVTKEVTFEGQYLGVVKDSWGNTRAAFKFTAQINRRDFNVNYDDKFDLGPVVGNDVLISIISEVTLAK